MTLISRSIRIYYSDLDRLTLDCVWPVLQPCRTALGHCFWERHYAGGAHLRVSLAGSDAAIADTAVKLVDAAGAYVRSNPSPAKAYSPHAAMRMLEREREPFDSSDLEYRNNCIVESALPSRRYTYPSTEAEAMSNDFRHDAMPLAVAIMRSDDRRHQMFCIYLLYTLLAGKGAMPAGSVSLKSHWEGFAETLSDPSLIVRVQEHEAANAPRLLATLRQVVGRYETGTLDESPVLGEWQALFNEYSIRAEQTLARGEDLTYYPVDLKHAREMRDQSLANRRRSGRFTDVLFADERFLASMRYEPSFMRSRVMTNLLYILVALAGFNALDRQCFCYLTWRTIERHCDCDLTDILQANVANVLQRNSHRWATD